MREAERNNGPGFNEAVDCHLASQSYQKLAVSKEMLAWEVMGAWPKLIQPQFGSIKCGVDLHGFKCVFSIRSSAPR